MARKCSRVSQCAGARPDSRTRRVDRNLTSAALPAQPERGIFNENRASFGHHRRRPNAHPCARLRAGTGNGAGALEYKGDRMLLGKRSLLFVLLFSLTLTVSAAQGTGRRWNSSMSSTGSKAKSSARSKAISADKTGYVQAYTRQEGTVIK